MISLLFVAACLLTTVEAEDPADLRCWTESKNFAFPGLVQVPYKTLSSCLDFCKNTPECQVVDFDPPKNPPCWVQKTLSQAKRTSLVVSKTNTNYMLDRDCFNGLIKKAFALKDISCWTPRIQTSYAGLTRTPAPNLQSCLDQCKKQPNCMVVNWDTETMPECWMQTTIFGIKLDAFIPRASVTNFVLNRDCFKLTSTTDDLRCWTVSYHYAFVGLVQVPYTTLSSCLEFCKNTPECNVVDYDLPKNPPCWIQKNTALQVKWNNLVISQTNTDFMLDRNCLSDLKKAATAQKEKYLMCWTKRNDTRYTSSAMIDVPALVLNECLYNCYTNPSCKVINFDTKVRPPCYMMFSNVELSESEFKSEKDVFAYVHDEKCLENL